MREIVILHAPSPLGLAPPMPGAVPGTRHMPAALRGAGLHESLGARFAGVVAPPAYDPAPDPETGIRNAQAIASYSRTLADRIGALLDSGSFPVVLGGDCSILLGCALALRRRGRFGLVYIDAHTDALGPESSATGGAAGMDLALATGRGPALLADMDGRRPYFLDEAVVVIGCRNLDGVAGGEPPVVHGTAVRLHDRDALRSRGVEAVAIEALRQLAATGVTGLWVHVDADVLDPAVMPAVDSPEPDGLDVDELGALLGELLRSPLAVGLNATIYDPTLDPTGQAGRAFAGAIEAGIRQGLVPAG